MAFKKTLAQRLFNISTTQTQTLANSRISNPPRFSPNPTSAAADSRDSSIFRRFLHRTSAFSPGFLPELRSLPTGEKLAETLRAMDISRSDRIRLEGVNPPAEREGLTVEDARKLLRAAQMEAVRSGLRGIDKSCVSYPEFVQICGDCCGDDDRGVAIAKAMDECGAVIVLGKTVFLRPDQEIEKL